MGRSVISVSKVTSRITDSLTLFYSFFVNLSSPSPSCQPIPNSLCTFCPFIIHLAHPWYHLMLFLLFSLLSHPLVTFQFRQINLRSSRPSFTVFPSITLLSCPPTLTLSPLKSPIHLFLNTLYTALPLMPF